MKAQLRKAWESRSPRDRVIIAVLAAVVLVMLYIWLLSAAYQARSRLDRSVAALRTQSLHLQADADELARVRAAPALPASKSDLRAQVQAQTGASGLAGALLSIDARGENHVQVAFGSVRFADWLAWVAALQAQHIRLDTGRIEAMSTPGLVSVTATFARAKAQ